MTGFRGRLQSALAVAGILAIWLSGCGKTAAGLGEATGLDGGVQPETAFVCPPVAPVVCPDPPPVFGDVEPIIQARCVPCHDDQPDAAWPLQTYRQVADWASVVKNDVILCTMPPTDGGIVMTDDERQALIAWSVCGAQE